jgi:hypothetical protein
MDRLFPPATWKAALIYAFLTLIYTYPLSLRPGSVVFGDNPDTHLFMWILGWDTHAFVHQPLSIFDANIYFPYDNTLAFSENLIGLAFIAAPVLWITDNPVLAMNVTALVSCVLCGIGGYVLGKRLGLGWWAALLCGLVFAFSPARFVRTGQLHVGAVGWIALTLASLHAYLDTRRPGHLKLACAFFSMQALTTGHGAVFLTLTAGGLCLFQFLLGESLAPLRRLRDLGLTGALLLAPALLVYLPYRRVSREMGFHRTFEPWQPTPGSFLAAPVHLQHWLFSWFPGADPSATATAYLFPGYVPLLLAAVAVVDFVRRGAARDRTRAEGPGVPIAVKIAARALEVVVVISTVVALLVLFGEPIRWKLGGMILLSVRDPLRPMLLGLTAAALRAAMRRRVALRPVWMARAWWRARAEAFWAMRREAVLFYGLLTLFCMAVLLPPPIGVWPHIYGWPGFTLIRAPGRIIVVAVLALAVLAAFGFERIADHLSAPRRRWFVAAIILALLVECAGMPVPVEPFRVPRPTLERWLATQPAPFAVAEFPVRPDARWQTVFMLHSMAHWQRTVHGYSGYEAALHTELFQQMRGFPDDVSLASLHALGVRYAIVHRDLYRDAWPGIVDRLAGYADRLTLVHEDTGGRIYLLR